MVAINSLTYAHLVRICISQNHHFFSDLKIRLRERGAVDLGGLEDETIFCLLRFLV